MNDFDLAVGEILCVRQNILQSGSPYISELARKHMSIAYTLSGTIRFECRDGTFTLSEGDMVLVYQGEKEESYSVTPESSYYYVDFMPTEPVPMNVLPRVSKSGRAAELFETLYLKWNSRLPGYQLVCRELLYSLLSGIYCSAAKTDGISRHQKISPAILHIETEFHQPLTCASLAALCGISESSLARLFLEITGLTPMRYLQNVRMNYAKRELERGAYSIGEIAERCGYADVFSFSRSFKRVTGKAPSEWKG